MNETDLVSIIRSHRDNSLGVEDGELSTERATALNHYHGRPYGNEVEGRSQVVSRDLAEAVDWALPGIMRVLVQSGTFAQFKPVGEEDEQLAEQESDYVNHVLMQENAGFMVLHDVIKDALLLKNGYTKQIWEDTEEVKEEQYEGLTLDQLTMMVYQMQRKGATVDITGQEQRIIEIPSPIPSAQPAAQIQVWDVKLKITRKCGKAKWYAVPPEEVRVSKKCRGSLQESPFTEHVTRKTRSDLIEMGMPRGFVDELASVNESSNGTQEYARDSVDDESDSTGANTGDRSMDEIEYCEAYLKVDYDGDGVAELRKVVTCGDRIPPGEQWNEPIPSVPLTGWAIKRVPHRHVGESLDDEGADIQEMLTTLKRQLNDNIYLSNNAEIVLNTDYANLRDFMTRTPGGIKRVRGQGMAVQGAVMPLPVQPIINQILPVLDFYESSKQKRWGIDGAQSGVSPDVLQETTKGAFMENLNRLGQKIEMITRLLVETGGKESVLQMHGLLMRHQNVVKQVQLKGKWTPINPQEWKERTDLTVNVGLGTGSEDDKRQKLMMLTQFQGQLLQIMMQAPPKVYAKAYALFEDMAKTLGVENPEKYAVAPNSPEYQRLTQQKQQAQQQGDPKMAVEKAKLMQQGQLEQQRMTMQTRVDQNRQEMEARQQQAKMQSEMQLEQMKAMLKAQSDQQRAEMDIQFQRWKAELDAAVRIQTANISSKAKVNDAATMAATGEIAAEVTQEVPQQTPPVEGGGEMV